MAKPLGRYKAITFDCYGTLIDWETGIWDAGQNLLKYNKCDTINRDLFLKEFADWETKFEAENPTTLYPSILAQVHKNIAIKYNLITSKKMDETFGNSVPHWPAFCDSSEALRRLQNHAKLFVLSNVDRASFQTSNLKLGIEFEAVFTAEEIGSYKPNTENFRYLINSLKEDFNIQPSEILHTAQSLHHDLIESAALGLDTAWIDRQRLSNGGKWGATSFVREKISPNYLFFSMSEMVTHFLDLS